MLARGREIVGRYTRHHGRPALGIEKKQLGIGPYVGGIASHEDRDVADEPDPFFVAEVLEEPPLPEEQKLCKAMAVDGVAELGPGGARVRPARGSTSSRGQSCQLRLPLACWSARKSVKSSSQADPCRREKSSKGPRRKPPRPAWKFCHALVSTRFLNWLTGSKATRSSLNDGAGAIALVDKSLLEKHLGANEIGVAREGRERLVRRIAETGRPKWQHLPPLLPAARQRFNPAIGGRAQIADAERPRQAKSGATGCPRSVRSKWRQESSTKPPF